MFKTSLPMMVEGDRERSTSSSGGGLTGAFKRWNEPEQVQATRKLAYAFSEQIKMVANEPMLGLYQVQEHIRHKGVRDQVIIKDKLLARLTELRHSVTSYRTSKYVESDEDPTSTVELDKAEKTVDSLAFRIDALRERLEIVSGIQEEFTSPSQKKQLSKKNYSSASESSLPVGVGQHLDNNLISGDLDVDEYVMSLSKLADTYSEMQQIQKERDMEKEQDEK